MNSISNTIQLNHVKQNSYQISTTAFKLHCCVRVQPKINTAFNYKQLLALAGKVTHFMQLKGNSHSSREPLTTPVRKHCGRIVKIEYEIYTLGGIGDLHLINSFNLKTMSSVDHCRRTLAGVGIKVLSEKSADVSFIVSKHCQK